MSNEKFIFIHKLFTYNDMHFNYTNVCVMQIIRKDRITCIET